MEPTENPGDVNMGNQDESSESEEDLHAGNTDSDQQSFLNVSTTYFATSYYS